MDPFFKEKLCVDRMEMVVFLLGVVGMEIVCSFEINN
jgi:hypothetical protein